MVWNSFQGPNTLMESLKSLKEKYPDELWKSVIPIDTQFREASRQGMPLSYLNPHARGAIAYATLLDTLLGTNSAETNMAAVLER